MPNLNQENDDADGTPANGPHDREVTTFDRILDWIVTPFVVVYMFFREPYRFLNKRVYSGRNGGFWTIVGAVSALGLGILAGYKMRSADVSWMWWVGGALLTIASVYCYAFPLSVYVFFEKFADWSRPLWRRAEELSRGKLTNLLKLVAIVSYVAFWLHAKEPLVQWLDKGDWGTGLWLIGGGIALLISISVTATFGLPAIALASSFVVLYLMSNVNAMFVPFVDFAPSAQVWAVNIAEWLVWLGFGFPLCVLLVHAVVRRLGDAFEAVMNRVYDHPDNDDFQKLFAHVLTLGGSVAVGMVAWHFAPQYGFNTALAFGLWNFVTYGLLCVIVFVAYIYGGRMLLEASNIICGIATAGGAGFGAYLVANAFGFGIFSCWGSVAVAAVFGFIAIFPAVYLALEFVGAGIAPALRKPLDEMHKTLSTEIIQSYSHCYSDTTPYAKFFAQVINIAVTLVVTFAAFTAIGAANVVSCIFGCSAAILFTYCIAGKALKRQGNAVVSIISGIAIGAVVGVNMYATYALLWCIAGAVAAIAVYCGAIFPVAYVLVRAPLVKVLRVDAWAGRFLVWMYSGYEEMLAHAWERCAVLYVPIKEAAIRAYNRIKASSKARMERIKARFTR